MTAQEALNILSLLANERAQDARVAGQPLTADLIAINARAATEVLRALVDPQKKTEV